MSCGGNKTKPVNCSDLLRDEKFTTASKLDEYLYRL